MTTSTTLEKPKATQPQETLLKYLTDMHAVENQLAHTLKRQVKNEDLGHFPEANSFVQRLLARTESSLQSLDYLIKELGGNSGNSLKDTVTAATGTVLGTLAHGRTHHITKMLRDDYTTLSLLSIGYELLHATGNALEAPRVASQALTNLKEVASFIMEISQSIIPVAVEELAETNTIDSCTVDLSKKNIRNAWKRQ